MVVDNSSKLTKNNNSLIARTHNNRCIFKKQMVSFTEFFVFSVPDGRSGHCDSDLDRNTNKNVLFFPLSLLTTSWRWPITSGFQTTRTFAILFPFNNPFMFFLSDSSRGSFHCHLRRSRFGDGRSGGLLSIQRWEETVLRLFLWFWPTSQAVEEELWTCRPEDGLIRLCCDRYTGSAPLVPAIKYLLF